MKILICTILLTLTGAMAAYSDIPRPQPEPPSKGYVTTLNIKLDQNAKEAKLMIPRSQIKQLRAELEQLDNGGDTALTTGTGSFGRTQTIVSGLFLSLAIVFGGIWLVRTGKAATRTAKTLVILAAVSTLATAATFVYANAGPPSEARSITGKMFSQAVHIYGFGYGQVRVQTSNDARLELIVPDPKETKPGE